MIINSEKVWKKIRNISNISNFFNISKLSVYVFIFFKNLVADNFTYFGYVFFKCYNEVIALSSTHKKKISREEKIEENRKNK